MHLQVIQLQSHNYMIRMKGLLAYNLNFFFPVFRLILFNTLLLAAVLLKCSVQMKSWSFL